MLFFTQEFQTREHRSAIFMSSRGFPRKYKNSLKKKKKKSWAPMQIKPCICINLKQILVLCKIITTVSYYFFFFYICWKVLHNLGAMPVCSFFNPFLSPTIRNVLNTIACHYIIFYVFLLQNSRLFNWK